LQIALAGVEKDPPPPSHVVAVGDSPESVSIAENRSTSAKRLRRALSGDLDTIVLMSMRKEPGRRYSSAQQMASDIQRYLEGKPVIARRDTMPYRTTKFLKRHWLPVTAAAGVVLLTLSFATTTYIQSLRIAAERDRAAVQRERAERERIRAEEISSFLVNLFKLSDPEETRGSRASLLMHFARLLVDRGKYAEALSKSDESIKIWTATSSASNPQTALAHAIHAYALEHLGKSKPAAEELDAAVPVLVKARGTDDAVVRRAQNWLKTANPDAVQTASASVTVHRP
jgi:serine/threonine-protein kinase